MSAFSGEIANPGTYNDDIRKSVARGRRETFSSTTTTEVAVMGLYGIAVKAGRSYRCSTSPLECDSSVATDTVRIYFRYATAGDTPTTSSTVLAWNQIRLSDSGVTEGITLDTRYNPAADGILSLLLTVNRAAGSGNVGLGGSSEFPIEMFVDDMGPDPGNTGIAL